jgi:RNA polymerase sigma factor (sigma-70 family)
LEGARIVAALVRTVHDVGLAEELAQDALVAALEQWPEHGVPDNPGAWLMTTARRRAIDRIRRERDLKDRHGQIARVLRNAEEDASEPDPDDVLRLLFLTCHPCLSERERIALTLRLVAGLTTAEIARAFLTDERTILSRVAAAKRTLAERGARFETPSAEERDGRLASVLGVVYLVFNEGYAATSGDDLMRPGLCLEALRLGRRLADLVPGEAEAHGLLALMELHQSRAGARTDTEGSLVPLHEQNRGRWDPLLVRRGFTALLRSREAGGPPGPYVLQAAIAACHARARSPEDTDWARITALYDQLLALRPTPVVRLNRAVAVGRALGPEAGLELVDSLAADPVLRDYHLLPGVRGDLLMRLDRREEARAEFERAAALTVNTAERSFLRARAEGIAVTAPRGPTLGAAVADFLSREDLEPQTRHSYGQTLRRLRLSLGESAPLAGLTAEGVAVVFANAWGSVAARTWNRHRAAVRSFGEWTGAADLAAELERRALPPGRAAVTGADGSEPAQPTLTPPLLTPPTLDRLWEREDIALRERVLWRLLYESGAGVTKVLSLDVQDLDLDDRRARSGTAWVSWRSRTARLLPELVAGRNSGPLFLTDRRPGPGRPPGPGDLCPVTGRGRLSYPRAEYLFKRATRDLDPRGEGFTLGMLSRAARPTG